MSTLDEPFHPLRDIMSRQRYAARTERAMMSAFCDVNNEWRAINTQKRYVTQSTCGASQGVSYKNTEQRDSQEHERDMTLPTCYVAGSGELAKAMNATTRRNGEPCRSDRAAPYRYNVAEMNIAAP